MKHLFKSFIFLFVYSTSLFVIKPLFISSTASQYTTYTYAQIKNESVYLYKNTSSTSLTNAYFSLPSTYFVLLLSNIDQNFYKVQYRDIVVFVLKNQVTPVAEKPQTPYLEKTTFRVYSSDGTNMLSSPFQNLSPSTISTVEVLQEMDYYGEIIADELIENRGSVWYYCKDPKTNLQGYLYKGLCDNMTTISPNTEKVTFIDNPFPDNDNSFLYNLVDISPGLKIILVLIICLPSLGLIYLMFKPFNIEKQKLIKQKRKFKKNKLKNQTINKIQKIIDDEELL